MHIADINAETRALCDADTTSYTAADLLRRVNAAYEWIVGKIMCVDGNWEFDDTNYTDFPRGTTTLVEDQHDYTFDTTHLAIESVQVKDVNGDWYYLSPINRDALGVPLEQEFETNGLPLYYDKDGGSLLLYPAPDDGTQVTLSSGLKVHFRRTADVYTSAEVTTGTKVPGFASPFHMILCYHAAIPYCMSYKKDRVALYEKKLQELTEDCLKFYAKRAKDERDIMTMGNINFR